MNKDENKPNQVDPKEELKHFFKLAFSEVKRSLQIIFKSLNAPFKSVTNPQDYSWKEIIVTFVVMTILVSIIDILFYGLSWFAIYGTLSKLVESFVLYAVLIGITWIVLENLQKGLKAQALFECWLMALVPTSFLSMFISLLSLFSLKLIWLRYFSASIFFSLILVFLFYLGLMARFSLPRKLAGSVSLGIGVILIIINYTWGAIGYRLGTDRLYLNPFPNYSLKEVNEGLKELGKQYDKYKENIGSSPKSKSEENESNNNDPKRRIKLSNKVMTWINKTYKDPKQRAAVIQNAKALELVMLAAMNEKGVTRAYATNEEDRSCECIRRVFTTFDEYMTRDLYKVVIDTPAKVRAFAKWNQSWSGQLLGNKEYSEEEACDR